ncbi:hypothetical protein MAR_005152 [Mya arenaria]|uniref:Uncharacterized protein n=1 Tax=Mya arenaria TaxID=6604 RepID=A0ABY7F0C1_MYAAR|nr:hypothetical protein MAR_005152 [Mya arenaria]
MYRFISESDKRNQTLLIAHLNIERTCNGNSYDDVFYLRNTRKITLTCAYDIHFYTWSMYFGQKLSCFAYCCLHQHLEYLCHMLLTPTSASSRKPS